MRTLLSFFMTAALILFSAKNLHAQTNTFPSTGAAGIGTTSPDPSSLLDIFSTSKGVLIPRMTRIQRDAITTPSTGLLIFQTNSTPGFYYYTGSAWVPISAKGANTALSNLAATTSVNQSLLPNITSTLDLGSSSLKWRDIYTGSLKFSDGTQQTTASQWIANGSNVYFNGAVGIGVSSPAYKLDISGDINLANGNVLRVSGMPVFVVNTTLGNIAAGKTALLNNTTGYSNVAVGISALYNNTTSSNTVAVGDSALYNNGTGAVNSYDATKNTAVGSKALYSNTVGAFNTANGYGALQASSQGYWNTATGVEALSLNTIGSRNVANGAEALRSNTTGTDNTATGEIALYRNTTGYDNTANGNAALNNNTTGNSNTADGKNALISNTQGYSNVAVGTYALSSNVDNSNLVAVGDSSLLKSNGATFNTAVGSKTLINTTTGSNNTAIGRSAGAALTTQSNNTIVGAFAGNSKTSANATLLGYNDDPNASGYTNITAVGYSVSNTASNQVRIGNNNVTTIGGAVSWSVISDGRFKKNIRENVVGLAFINKLKPISYTLDITGLNEKLSGNKGETGKTTPSPEDLQSIKEKEKIRYNGFVAQDVEKAAKDLNYDFSGVDAPKNDNDLYGLRYSDFVVPLVKAVQELSKTNDDKDSALDEMKSEIGNLKSKNDAQQQQIDALTAQISRIENAMSQCCSSFSSSISSSNSNSSINKSSEQARLEQNVPNPFDGSCYIGYYIPSGAHNAQLRIADVRGHTLKTYSLTTPGYGKQTIYGSELSSGMYQYSLLIDGKLIDTKKMVVAR